MEPIINLLYKNKIKEFEEELLYLYKTHNTYKIEEYSLSLSYINNCIFDLLLSKEYKKGLFNSYFKSIILLSLLIESNNIILISSIYLLINLIKTIEKINETYLTLFVSSFKRNSDELKLLIDYMKILKKVIISSELVFNQENKETLIDDYNYLYDKINNLLSSVSIANEKKDDLSHPNDECCKTNENLESFSLKTEIMKSPYIESLNYKSKLKIFEKDDVFDGSKNKLNELLSEFSLLKSFGFTTMRNNIKNELKSNEKNSLSKQEEALWEGFNEVLLRIPDISLLNDVKFYEVTDINYKLYYIFKKTVDLLCSKEGNILIRPYFLKILLNNEIFLQYLNEKISIDMTSSLSTCRSSEVIPSISKEYIFVLMKKNERRMKKEGKYCSEKIYKLIYEIINSVKQENSFEFQTSHMLINTPYIKELFIDVKLVQLENIDAILNIKKRIKEYMSLNQTIIDYRDENIRNERAIYFRLKDEEYYIVITFNSLSFLRRNIFYNELICKSKAKQEVYNLIRSLFLRRKILFSSKNIFVSNSKKYGTYAKYSTINNKQSNEYNFSQGEMELYENELMILYLFYLKTINYIQFPEEESETYNKYLFPYGKIENSINIKEVYSKTCIDFKVKSESSNEIFLNFLFFIKNLLSDIETQSNSNIIIHLYSKYSQVLVSKNENFEESYKKVHLLDFIICNPTLLKHENLNFSEILNSTTVDKEYINKNKESRYQSFNIRLEKLIVLKEEILVIIHYFLKGDTSRLEKMFIFE